MKIKGNSIDIDRTRSLHFSLFDSRKLELQIRIPPEKGRKKTVILGGEGVPPEAANALSPSNFTV